MKKMCTVILFLLSLLFSEQVFSQIPNIMWWFDTHDSSFGQTAMDDIDHDGHPELVFGCYRNDSMVYALNAQDGSLLWKFNASGSAEGCNDTAPLIFDVDNDGFKEVIVAASCNPKTFCLNGSTGSIKWQTPTRGSDSPPTIADIDNDGILDIIHGEFGGYVICINGNNGSIKWEIPVDVNSWIQTAPTIVDLDGDSQLDFVVATWHFSNNNKIYAYRGNDQSLLWSYNLADVVYHGTAVADLDKNGKPELIIGDYSGKLYVFKGDTGDTLWTFDAGAYIGSPVSTGDLNGDGYCEVIFTSWYKVFALNHDGSVFWQYNIPGYNSSFRGAALSDVDNDQLPDVIFGTSGGNLITLKGTTGQPLWDVDLEAHFGDTLEIDHAPVVADFDGNGTLDVFVVGGDTKYPNFQNNYGRAYAVEAGFGAGPVWPMFQYDARRTGNICDLQNAEIPETQANQTLSVFPNPIKAGELLNIQYDINEQITNVTVSDISGKLIFCTMTHHNSVHIPENIEQGVYILSIQTTSNSESKLLIIK